MSFRLVDKGWGDELRRALKADVTALRVICPFIKCGVVDELLAVARPRLLQVITRFDCCAFYQGVNDLSALRRLLEHGAAVRGVKNVHAKLYLVAKNIAIVTSANLTASALHRNAEFGFVTTDAEAVPECHRYFESMWKRAGSNLTARRLRQFEQIVERFRRVNGRVYLGKGLPDFGKDLGIPPNVAPVEVVANVAMPPQAFVKFWGISRRERRLARSTTVLDDVAHSGCHLACTYPKRPRSVQDGAAMFMGRMVKDPNDIIIQGRAFARRHDPELDVASAADIARREFMRKYRYLIRVENPEFINGTLADGISLNRMMEELRSNSFRSTKENAAAGNGRNTDPRRAYGRHPGVELSDEGFSWLNAGLEKAFAEHGKLSRLDLDGIEKLPVPRLFGERKR
jgi:PLD-like domain